MPDVGACLDLGAFDRDASDRGVRDFLRRTGTAPGWVVLMEDRQPDFLLGYQGFDPGARVPLNRHGPRPDVWTEFDLAALVGGLQDAGVQVLVGAWMHECAWIDDRHPETLLRGADGALWQDRARRSADFNPLKRLRADDAHAVADGTPFPELLARQWSRLRDAFGFDGLFLGDGGMGFRRFGRDAEDALHYDFDASWVEEFQATGRAAAHADCAVLDPPTLSPRDAARAQAHDVRTDHAEAWVAWTRERWTGFYRALADAVHADGGVLGAYSVMNYDPILAREHGADYRAIAEAGLDLLVLQTYGWAWGPNGPLTPVDRKDEATNLLSLLLTRGHLGHDTRTKLLFTTETSDAVERWRAPLEVTLREIATYAGARSFDGTTWVPAADGTFVVWANHVDERSWRAIDAACRRALRDTPPRRGVVVWDDAVLDAPHESGSYEHITATTEALGALPDGVAAANHEAPALAVPLPRARATPRPRRR